jgi:hypothetical protein
MTLPELNPLEQLWFGIRLDIVLLGKWHVLLPGDANILMCQHKFDPENGEYTDIPGLEWFDPGTEFGAEEPRCKGCDKKMRLITGIHRWWQAWANESYHHDMRWSSAPRAD